MPATYDNLGVRFLYPENWCVTEEDFDGWPRTVTVTSPGGGFWSVHVYPRDAAPGRLTDQIVETMRGEYDSLEAVAAAEEIAGLETTGHDMDFYCLDLVVSARTRCLRHGEHVLLFFYQAESRDFETLAPVFKALAHSLLTSQGNT